MIDRLQKELLITSSIAAEVFAALNDSGFPNIRDLLSTFSRAG